MTTGSPPITPPIPSPSVVSEYDIDRLLRMARESIEGRKSFEETVGRKSTKPLTAIEIPPDVLVFLLVELRLLRQLSRDVEAFYCSVGEHYVAADEGRFDEDCCHECAEGGE